MFLLFILRIRVERVDDKFVYGEVFGIEVYSKREGDVELDEIVIIFDFFDLIFVELECYVWFFIFGGYFIFKIVVEEVLDVEGLVIYLEVEERYKLDLYLDVIIKVDGKRVEDNGMDV